MERESRPLFSILVPVYKAEAYLHQCVDSVLGQSCPDFELILVDDGSPDASGAICDEYAQKDSRVRVIHKKNGGNVSARKAGLAVSVGKYIVHVDSDDYIADGLLEQVADTIRTHQADAVLFGYTKFSETEQIRHKQGVSPGTYEGASMDIIRQNLILGSNSGVSIFGNLCTIVIRRERFIPYAQAVPETIYRGEDQAAVVPAIAACDCVTVLDQCGYYYRTTPGSIMQTVRMDEVDQANKVAAYLSEKMGPDYQNRLDCYVLKEFFDFLNQIAHLSYQDYRKTIRDTLDEELQLRLKRAQYGKDTHITDKAVFFIIKHQYFAFFWLLKRIKK